MLLNMPLGEARPIVCDMYRDFTAGLNLSPAALFRLFCGVYSSFSFVASFGAAGFFVAETAFALARASIDMSLTRDLGVTSEAFYHGMITPTIH